MAEVTPASECSRKLISNFDTKKLLEDVLEILKDEKVFDTTGEFPVVEFSHPHELQKKIDIKLKNDGSSGEEIKDAVRKIAHYSVKTSNPHFHNQLFSGVDSYGLAGALLTECCNTSQYTYEVAPVFQLLERQVLDQSLKLVGYPGYPESDGILCPGGSMSNMYGIVLARYSRIPEIKTKGLSGLLPLAMFTSDLGHYSISKAAHWLGLGTNNIYTVKSDELGRMDPEDLKKNIKDARTRGTIPFFVNATAGTTVVGSIDPLEEIAAICKQENLWFHIDACLGGTLLLSKKYRDRLKGVELSDSVSWNPHKMLGAPLQCSLFLVKRRNLLHEANCSGATYLFQQDKFYDVSWDTGDKSVQCGRKVDAVKLWLMWKARGTDGLSLSVDTAMDCVNYFFNKIKDRQGYRLVFPKYEGNTICFWYIPPSMRAQEETEKWWEKLYALTAKIKELLVLDGRLLIGYSPLSSKKIGNFFRMVVCCQPTPTYQSMDFVLQQIEFIAHKL
ncbi:cysteine sulfinic acid decarboxylase [Microplitis demolitor]|uniref:cysteine sulfinic acid decarboxylase n=1 Tax=Microplitis demolitor TaxID=69319 RepID=UPI0004CDBA36|nr:cysteine sulfinic acid decarboxylase [Microplitis demolitor]